MAASRARPCCCCHVRGFIQPSLLLRLARRPAHGYDLLEELRQTKEVGCCDAAQVYRTLRKLEQERLVRSEWETPGGGPARRTYRLTDKGLVRLHRMAEDVAAIDRVLRAFLAEYESLLRSTPDSPRGG